MANDLRDRVIVITGGSSGIGAATAKACGAAGMKVVLHARRADRLEESAAAVRSAGGDAHVLVGDVTEPDHDARLLDAAESAYGAVDAVFANAGCGLQRAIVDETDAESERLWAVNYFASARLARTAARRWIAAEREGHVLLCSSCLARFALPLYGSYAATKAAQAAIAASMRLELAPHGIAVSSVHPVTTSTEFFTHMSADGSATPDHTPERFVQSPDTVARAIVRCLRKPVPEVWTSPTVRFAAGLFTLFPGFGVRMLRRQSRRELRAYREARTRG